MCFSGILVLNGREFRLGPRLHSLHWCLLHLWSSTLLFASWPPPSPVCMKASKSSYSLRCRSQDLSRSENSRGAFWKSCKLSCRIQTHGPGWSTHSEIGQSSLSMPQARLGTASRWPRQGAALCLEVVSLARLSCPAGPRFTHEAPFFQVCPLAADPSCHPAAYNSNRICPCFRKSRRANYAPAHPCI